MKIDLVQAARDAVIEAARGFTDPASGTNYGALAESVRALDALSSAHPSPEPFSEENKALRAIAEIDESLKNHERRLSCVERVAHSPVPLSAAIFGLDARLSALEQSRAPRTEGKDIEVGVAARVGSARRAGVVEGLERAKVLYVTVPHDIQHHRAFTLGSKALRDSIDSELQRLREETPTTAPNAAGKGGSAPLDTAGQPGSSATSPETKGAGETWIDDAWRIANGAHKTGHMSDGWVWRDGFDAAAKYIRARTIREIEEWAERIQGPVANAPRSELRSMSGEEKA